jgi:iron complex outermembrane recepter protein
MNANVFIRTKAIALKFEQAEVGPLGNSVSEISREKSRCNSRQADSFFRPGTACQYRNIRVDGEGRGMKFLPGLIHVASGHVRGWQHFELHNVLRSACLTLAVVALMAVPAWPQQKPEDLSDKSLEDLMNIEVTSVSKKEQTLSQVASAIFIITQDNIRHSGATNIPDLLRMVPGLDVAQINGSTWAISSRGLNSQFANKLLVLIDGRTVYTPLFAGVYWDVQDVPLEDIERIEVIRGPGATVWGANAVNGVINIITKSSKETQGSLLTGGGGTHESGFGLAQYGGKFNQAASYRFFVKGFDRSSFPSFSGQDGHDGSDLFHAGFRVDSPLSKQDSLIVQGDLYKGSEGEIDNTPALTPPFASMLDVRTSVSGENILGRWNHSFSPHSDMTLQVYFDQAERNSVLETETVDTTDIDFQHHFERGSRQDFVWGVGYRHFSYAATGGLQVSFNPVSEGHQLFSTFVQDEITLKPDRLYLTIGAKFEHNDFSGFEFQPDVRITGNLTKNQMLWAGYSRARRTPSPADRGLRVGLAAFPGPGVLPVLLTLLGSAATVSENLDAFEAGYRTQPRANISMDLTIFYNRYGTLTTSEPGTPFLELNPQPPHLNVPIIFANLMNGETHGLETAVNWKVTDRWTLSPGYAFQRIHLQLAPTSQDQQSVSTGEGNSPHHQAQLRSHLALPRGFEWNASVYFVSRLPAQQVPSYTRLDTGITWRPSERVVLSLVGQNLLRDHHLEANGSDQSEISSLIKRSVYAKLAWQF